MRKALLRSVLLLAGCASQNQPADATLDAVADAVADAAPDAAPDAPDAAPDAALDAALDAAPDAPLDVAPEALADAALDAAPEVAPDVALDVAPEVAPDAGCPRVLLVGGTDVAAQGWQVMQNPPATVSYGADYVQLATTTLASSLSGGQLLLAYPGAVTPGRAFRLQVVMQVVSTDPHNAFDSAAALLGSFTAPYGAAAERSEMVYLDTAAVGWADDTQTAAVSVVNGAYHTYELSVDASNVARLSVDGTARLMRSGYTTNGTIAVGDQTNDARVDSTLRVRSITLLCP